MKDRFLPCLWFRFWVTTTHCMCIKIRRPYSRGFLRETQRGHLRVCGRVLTAGLPVPRRRGADRERADVAIEESYCLSNFPPPSTARISELVWGRVGKHRIKVYSFIHSGANCTQKNVFRKTAFSKNVAVKQRKFRNSSVCVRFWAGAQEDECHETLKFPIPRPRPPRVALRIFLPLPHHLSVRSPRDPLNTPSL
jgi:hypothetical protein